MERRTSRLTKEPGYNPEAWERARKGLALRKKFEQDASVVDFERGYINIPWVNQLVIPRYKEYAADLIVYEAVQKFGMPDKVAGIPVVGNPLANSVSTKLDVPLALGRKGNNIPGSWKQTIIIEDDVPSFTTGKTNTFSFNGIEKGDKVLIVDDIIAFGDTSIAVVEGFRAHGVTPYLAVYCAKLFQPGVDRLREIGIDPIYIYGVTKLTDDGPLLE